ncbi:MAG: hypothetical protein NZ551_05330 [Microscillaceae bacterium]|nr:hypothetical protein [Microscillaceae bacterium]MDW8460617.1 hypothetical protein [Cytophagales bacterium]
MIAVPSIQKIGFLIFAFFMSVVAFLVTGKYTQQKKKHQQRIQSVDRAVLATEVPQASQEMKPALYVYYNYKPNDEIQLNNLQKQGLVLYVDTLSPQNDYQSRNFIKVFLINASSQTSVIPVQERSLIMIQEALNEDQQWKPIEYWSYDWGRGRSQDSLVLENNYIVQTFAPRYKGNFKTKIRFKLRTNLNGKAQYLYSPAFSASIPKEQFNPTQNPVGNKQAISFLDESKVNQ